MFGESDSESPRVPSPWDPFLASPSSPSVSDLDLSSPRPAPTVATLPNDIPKLVPEAEQGNIEYKLILKSPTPARFARLVTQLKWRLLEGGGQAYYELGVTDNGLLIGLSRTHLEQSLETLEMMAGEIGASVIIVKEIEVPREVAQRSEKLAARYVDFETGDVKRSERDAIPDSGDASTTTSSGTESDSDSPVAIFSMDSDVPALPTSNTPIDLEISSVYKPRPMRINQSLLHRRDDGKRKSFQGGKKKQKVHPVFHALPPTSNTMLVSNATPVQAIVPKKQSNKVARRPQTRNKKREEKKHLPDSTDPSVNSDAKALIPALDDLHVSLDLPSPTVAAPATSPQAEGIDSLSSDVQSKSPVDEYPRLIVEVLVVRKLSLEEAFLDFGGFGFEV